MQENGLYGRNMQKSEVEITKEIKNLENEIEKLDDCCNTLWVLKEKKRMEFKANMRKHQVGVNKTTGNIRETVVVRNNQKKKQEGDIYQKKQIDQKSNRTRINRFCPYCGASVNGMRFCGQCGNKVND